MNKKSGETFMCNVGKRYLEFLLTLQWLCKSDKKVIAKLLFIGQKFKSSNEHLI